MSEPDQAKLDALRAALIEGEQSGSAAPFDFEAFLARKRGSVSPTQ
jgi:antitoxin ParD1/3/4